jgi:hypothetical protein
VEDNPPSSILTNTENWNGTNWTEVNDLNLARYSLGGQTGTNTSSLAVGGSTPAPPTTANTEDWNGASWVEVADLNTARQSLGGNRNNFKCFSFWWITWNLSKQQKNGVVHQLQLKQ